jgi:hypothetical protein
MIISFAGNGVRFVMDILFVNDERKDNDDNER